MTTTSTPSLPAGREQSPWLTPSAMLREQIEDHADRLPWTHGRDRIDEVSWFIQVGEPAYARLLELAADSRPEVSGSALAALGATRDSRLVPYVQAIAWTSEVTPELELERARTLTRLGDWSEVPCLIAGLRSERLLTRALCNRALLEATGEKMGFNPTDDEAVREEAVQRWEAWWKGREREGMLAATSAGRL